MTTTNPSQSTASYESIKLGIGAHAQYYWVSRQVDGATPQPVQWPESPCSGVRDRQLVSPCLSGGDMPGALVEKSDSGFNQLPVPVSRGLSPFPAARSVFPCALRFPVRAKKVSRVREFRLVHNCELVGEEQYMRQFLPGRQGSR